MPRPRFASLEPARRDAILAAATEELARAGFEASSYNRIIERAGVSKGAMYYYFDDKEDLLLTALDDAVTRALAALGPAPAFRDAHGFWDALGELYRRVTDFVAAEPALAGLLKTALTRESSARVGEAVADYTTRLERWLAELLERGRALGAVRPDVSTGLLARLLTAMGDVTDRWLLDHWDELDPDDLEDYPRRALDLHLRVAAPLELVIERERRRP
jgi:AcrR family transcriptional regulator